MAIMRRVAALCSLLLFALAACAQPEPVDLCVVQGTIKFADGTPFPNMAVAIQVGGKEITPRPFSQADGSYLTAVPAGEATISVAGIQKTVKLTGGQQHTVDFELEKAGVILVVTHPDGKPVANTSISAAYKAGDNSRSINASYMLAAGRYWFRDLPKEATALSVIARIYAGYGESYYRQQWTLAGVKPMQELPLAVPKSLTWTVQVQDADGAPLPNAPVRMTVTATQGYPPFWDEENRPAPTQRRYNMGERRTDDKGLLPLGTWMPGRYQLSLRTGTQAGPDLVVELQGEEPVTTPYAMNLKPRDVTMTVFTKDGTPAANTKLQTSYAWQGKAIFGSAATDAKGVVVFKALPPVQVIVWGEGVPARIVPSDAVTITKPLPEPPSDNTTRSRYLRIKLTNVGKETGRLLYFTSRQGQNYSSSETTIRPDQPEGVTISPYFESRGALTLISFLAATKTKPMRIAALNDVYLPIAEENESCEVELPMTPGTVLQGTFTTKGAPVAGVSQFSVLPVKVETRISALASPEVARRLGLMQAMVGADGKFSVALPGPGQYRLLVDLYDEGVPPIPELLVDVPADGKTAEIALPKPMLEVPAGTVVSWLTPHAPAVPRRLTAAAHANPSPIFGPRDQLLALWFRPTPDKLVFWNALEKQQRVLTLRAAQVNPVDTERNPYSGSLTLFSLLPSQVSGGGNDPFSRASSEAFNAYLTADNRYLPAVWTGTYYFPAYTSEYGGAAVLGEVNIAQDSPAEITIDFPAAPAARGAAGNMRTVRLRARADAKRPDGVADNVAIYYDGVIGPQPDLMMNSYAFSNPNSSYSISLPQRVKSITCVWMGVGIIEKVVVPDGENPEIMLPAWGEGVVVSGRLLRHDGQPYASRQCTASLYSNQSNYMSVRTDAQGAFKVIGLLPGALYLFADSDQGSGGWTLEVPQKGLANLTLTVPMQPTRFSGVPSSSEYSQLWWFPDGGAPVRIPSRYGSPATFDPAVAGPGMLWAVDGYRGDSRYVRAILSPGGYTEMAQLPAEGSSLGLYFPLDPKKGTPGRVTLIGTGDRAGITVTFRTMAWHPSALLNRTVAQITAVPPGTYRVIAETAAGPVETTATVTATGGKAEFTFPAGGN